MKRYLIVVTILFLCSLPAGAVISQVEGFGLNALSIAQNNGESCLNLLIAQGQDTYGHRSMAAQNEQAIVAQEVFTTSGRHGNTAAIADTSMCGMQHQSVGQSLNQTEGLQLNLDTLAATDGAGGAMSVAGVVGAQNQIAVGPNGTMSASSEIVGATSYSAASGAGRCTAPAVATSSVDVAMGQSSNVLVGGG